MAGVPGLFASCQALVMPV